MFVNPITFSAGIGFQGAICSTPWQIIPGNVLFMYTHIYCRIILGVSVLFPGKIKFGASIIPSPPFITPTEFGFAGGFSISSGSTPIVSPYIQVLIGILKNNFPLSL